MASRIYIDDTKCKPPYASRSLSHSYNGGRRGNILESSLFRTAAYFLEQMILNWPKLDYHKHSSPSYKELRIHFGDALITELERMASAGTANNLTNFYQKTLDRRASSVHNNTP